MVLLIAVVYVGKTFNVESVCQSMLSLCGLHMQEQCCETDVLYLWE